METWKMWGIGAAVALIVGAFAKFAKKGEWAMKFYAWGQQHGKVFSFLLMRWLPAQAARKAEEGMIVTALDWMSGYLCGFEAGMLADNNERVVKKEEKKRNGGVAVGLLLLCVGLASCGGRQTVVVESVELPAEKEKKVAMVELEQEMIDSLGPITAGLLMAEPVKRVESYVCHFDFDSYAVRKNDQDGLTAWVTENGIKRVAIVGGADPVGGATYNYVLGMNRALAGGDVVARLGVHVLECESLGETRLVTENAAHYWMNRRAEVFAR